MHSFLYMFYIFFQGILFFQVLFLFAFYFIAKKRDSLYFALFLLFTGINFFIAAPEIFYGSTDAVALNSWWFKLFNTPLAMLGGLFFTLFLKAFFNNLIQDKLLTRLLHISIIMQLGMFCLFFVLYTLNIPTELIYNLENFVGLGFGIAMITVIVKRKMKFAGWVVWGFIGFIIGSFLSTTMLILRVKGVHHIFTDTYPFFFLKCGVLIEMTCYLIAIIKKWYFTENQVAIHKLESALVLERLRSKISGELHDDIGSTLSGISMYSFMVGNLLQSGQSDKAIASVKVIQKSATEMVDKLSDLVWSVNPRQDSLELFIERLEQYAQEMASAKNIIFKTHVQPAVFIINMPMENRYQIYLLAKEAINNAIKYSQATCVELSLNSTGKEFTLQITDNGIGFDLNTIKEGNGIGNMRRRAVEIKADFELQSSPGKGTTITLLLKSPNEVLYLIQ